MTDEVDYASLPILGELQPSQLEGVLPRCRIVLFGDQDIILHRDAANTFFHFLLSGRAQVEFDLANRSEGLEIKAGQMFGEMSVIDEAPVTAYIIAAGPCRVLLLPAEIFWSEIVTVPRVARSAMRAQSLLLRNNTAAMMRMLQERLRHEALERELRLARDIQMGMLRRADPWFPERSEFGISALIKPAKLVGGDFYDGFLLDKDHLVLAIGDVAGKGISAALFMVRALTLLRSPAAHWISLQQTLESANRQLAEDNDLDMFLSVFMAVMDLRTGGIEFINFGHPPPVVRLADGSVAFLECKPGTLFGLMPDAEGAAGNLTLAPGATLILYSDGVTEAEARDEEQFGNHRLIQAIAAADTPDAGVIVRSIAAGVRRHAGEAEQSDDITLLAVTYHGQA